jgi:K+-transporting ATPase ATPase A chain
MTANGWIQIAIFFALILLAAKPLGVYMARVFERETTWFDILARPVERLIYRLTGIDETHEMRWTEYAIAMLGFSLVTMVVTYAIERLQHLLPLNPQHLAAVEPALALNTAASFTTNTNWQSYTPETTMSYLTQMVTLAYHNFASAAVGIALAIAFVRGIAGRERKTLGNFWVDTTRATLWVLLPGSFVLALVLVSQGVVQNFRPYDQAKLVQPMQTQVTGADGKTTTQTVTTQTIAQGPVASQEAIKMLGTNGGGFFNANSAHPFENPTALSNLIEMFVIFLIPGALTVTLGRMVKSPGHGWAIFAAMSALFLAGVLVAYSAESHANPLLHGVNQSVSALQPQYGRQRGPLRHRQLGAVRNCNHRRELRRRQRHA